MLNEWSSLQVVHDEMFHVSISVNISSIADVAAAVHLVIPITCIRVK